MLTSFQLGPAARLRNRCFIVPIENKKKQTTPPPQNKSSTAQLICACDEVSHSFLTPKIHKEGTAAPGETQAYRKGKIYPSSSVQTSSLWVSMAPLLCRSGKRKPLE